MEKMFKATALGKLASGSTRALRESQPEIVLQTFGNIIQNIEQG